MFTKEETEAMRKKYRYYSIIEGIGINFLTENFKNAQIDEAYKISDEEAIFMANYIYEKEGLLIGGSSAVNLCAAVKASRKLAKGSRIVTIIYDSGEKYKSKSFKKEIMEQMCVKWIEDVVG
jgi:cysteine synthase A